MVVAGETDCLDDDLVLGELLAAPPPSWLQKGLVKKSIAPTFIARTGIGMSP